MNHLFFISWLRAKEKNLVDSIDVERMVGSADADAAFKILNDTDYAPYISGKDQLSIEELITEEKSGFRKLLEKMGMEKRVIEIVFLRDDFIHLRKELKEGISREKSRLSEKYEKEMEFIKNRNPKDPKDIDDLVTEIYFKKMADIAKELKEKGIESFLKEYWAILSSSGPEDSKDARLMEMESGLIEASKSEISGLAPILSFFIKKRRIEALLRNIFLAKRIGFPRIESLLGEVRVL